MEQIQLLDMDGAAVDVIDAEHHRNDRRNSLESLKFDFGRSTPARHPWKDGCCPAPRKRVFLVGTVVCCVLGLLGYILHHRHLEPAPHIDANSVAHEIKSSTWQQRLDLVPDFGRCPRSYADRPVLLVLSMDGFSASFVNRTKSISLIAEKGVSAPHMRPVFPSNTFPNHYSIVTGLYPESHGIIDNVFVDGNKTDRFFVWRPSKFDPKWWKGRPIWQVAQEQGRRVFARYWPGSEVLINGVRPTRYVNFTMNETLESRVAVLLQYLHLPKEERPHLVLNYFPNPDYNAHLFGYGSAGHESGIKLADEFVDLLMTGIHESNLTDCVDLIVLSDHGAANSTRAIYPSENLMRAFGEKAASMAVDSSTAVNRVNPAGTGVSVASTAEALACEHEESAYQVYSPETDDLPVRLHYRNNPDIPPVMLLANISVAMSPPRSNLTSRAHQVVHGWDPVYSEMQAMFAAFGPSFKTRTSVQPFTNIELFGLFADLLGIQAGENNGTEGSLRHLLNRQKPDDREVAAKAVYHPSLPHNSSLEFLELCGDASELQAKCSAKFSAPVFPHTLKDLSDFSSLHTGSFGLPNFSNIFSPRLIVNRYYAVGFCDRFGLPIWSSFGVVKIDGQSSKSALYNEDLACCVKDPRVFGQTIKVCPSSGQETIVPVPVFAQGIMSGAQYDGTSVLSTNIVFMYKSFRDAIWRPFWMRVSSWASLSVDGRIHVVVGPVFDVEPPFGVMDQNSGATNTKSVPVPTHFFVILTRKSLVPSCTEVSCFTDVISFVFPNRPKSFKKCQSEQFWLLTRTATVRDIERLTGLEFFTALPKQEAARLKVRLTDKLWDMDKML